MKKLEKFAIGSFKNSKEIILKKSFLYVLICFLLLLFGMIYFINKNSVVIKSERKKSDTKEIEERPKIILIDESLKEEIIVSNIENGVKWITKNNTLVHIKPNSIMDSKGILVKGSVTIQIKEFTDAFGAILSGIPMTYDSLDMQYNFRTGGMFDLNVYKKTEALKIKENASVDVYMSTNEINPKFNAYYLNPVNGNWEYLQKNKQLKRTFTYGTHRSKTKIDSNILWDNPIELSFDKEEFIEFRYLDSGIFYPYKGQDEKITKINSQEWETFDLIENKDTLNLKVISRKEIITLKVQKSVHSSKIKNQLQEKFQRNKPKKVVYELDNSKNVENLSFSPVYAYSDFKNEIVNSSIANLFSIKKFGTYNCDAPELLPKGMLAEKVIFLDSANQDTINKGGNYYLSEMDKKLMFKYYSHSKFSYNPESENLLWFVTLKDKKTCLYYVKNKQFNSHNNHCFTMRKIELNDKNINYETIKKKLDI